MNYFDACYIAKFYLSEADSPRVTAYAHSHPSIACLSTGRVEVVSVFHRKFREQLVDVAGYQLLCDQFESDCDSGLWKWIPFTADLLNASLVQIRQLPATTFLRAADALHLTCAMEHGFASVYTSDRHMKAAAPSFRLNAVTL
jgi:hypothetical protein